MAAVLAPVVGWSFANTIVKIVHVQPVAFAFWRLWLATATMLLVLVVTRRRVTWRILKASAPGGVLFALNLVFFFSAIRHTAVADVLVIGALQPALTVLAAGKMFGERVSRGDVLWILASVAGVIAFVVGSRSTPNWSLIGDLFAVGSLLVFTAYFFVSKRVRRQTGPVEFMVCVTVVAAVVITPIALLSGQPLSGIRWQDWVWLVVFAISAQGGHLLLAWAHNHVDLTVATLLILAETPLSAVIALVVLGQPLTVIMIVAGLLTMACLGVVVYRATRTSAVFADSEDAEPAPS
ncbi:MAG TPA: DMT family transporter [Acidimicrobiales bacterium]|nr:DMT family transporter [Acidimicrobiales bacterium]